MRNADVTECIFPTSESGRVGVKPCILYCSRLIRVNQENEVIVMMAPAVDSAFDVANWFIDKAIENKESLESGKLHVLLYLSQSYYAVLNDGAKLMPSVFVVEERGPIEPNVQRIFESEANRGAYYHPPEKVRPFLEGIWSKFGSHSGLSLSRSVKSHIPYKDAFNIGNRTEIPLNVMVSYYAKFLSSGEQEQVKLNRKADAAKTRVMRSHTGRAVNVRQWVPKKSSEA
ncbi:MAG: hypothetical protein GY804_15340 [Alphaproteobacteria bacterium]|nr:hypothetical protein [Alphaproteobacteria bacterium]